MKILGIDPGLRKLGFGIIDLQGNRYNVYRCGLIKTQSTKSVSERLNLLYEELKKLIFETSPSVMAIERNFLAQNKKSAIEVAKALGVVLLLAAQNNIPVYEYTPAQVKLALTGYGKALKHQVQYMVKRLLAFKDTFESVDVSDALAVAICHSNYSPHYYRQIRGKIHD